MSNILISSFLVNDNFEIQKLNTSHQSKYKGLCLYTSDGTENAWHRNLTIVNVIERFKEYMDMYQKGNHKDIHVTILNPLIDLTDERKYVLDMNLNPKVHGQMGYVKFDRLRNNKNFYYATSIENNNRVETQSIDNIYMKHPVDDLEIETIKWIYLKREKIKTILKLRKHSDFKKYFARKRTIKDFLKDDMTKCMIITGRDRQKIVVNLQNRISFSNVINIEKSRFFARNKGLIDVDNLEDMTVAIFGLGSLGSKIAEQLKRAGVGKFILFDHDQFSPENLSRHVLTTEDLFLNKSEAIKRRLLKINPWANVKSLATTKNILYYDELYDAMVRCLKESDFIICSTGNEESEHDLNYLLKDLSRYKNIPAIYTAILGNGFGGRIHRIEIGKTPCYQCIKIQQEKDPNLYKKKDSFGLVD